MQSLHFFHSPLALFFFVSDHCLHRTLHFLLQLFLYSCSSSETIFFSLQRSHLFFQLHILLLDPRLLTISPFQFSSEASDIVFLFYQLYLQLLLVDAVLCFPTLSFLHQDLFQIVLFLQIRVKLFLQAQNRTLHCVPFTRSLLFFTLTLSLHFSHHFLQGLTFHLQHLLFLLFSSQFFLHIMQRVFCLS